MTESPLSLVASEIARIRTVADELTIADPALAPLIKAVMHVVDKAFEQATSEPYLYEGEMPWWSDMQAK